MTKISLSHRITSRRRLAGPIAALVALALAASACSASTADITLSAETAPSDTQTTSSDAPVTSTNAAEVLDDGSYGPKPELQTFRISSNAVRYSGNLAGFDYNFTEIDTDDHAYMAVGDDAGLRASYLSQGGEYLEVCVETGDGCGAGSPAESSFFASTLIQGAFATWAPYSLDDGLRIAGGILLGESVGWEVIDDSFSFDGRPGRCYKSLGSYQWPGDEEPTEIAFPAGDIACVLFYETNSEYLVSYDFGGDGINELETTRLADTATNDDFALPAYAPAELQQAGLTSILDNVSELTNDYTVISSQRTR